MHWMILPLRRYAVFAGRARRREYWLFMLLYALILGVAATIDLSLGYGRFHTEAGPGFGAASATFWGPVSLIAMLVLLVPQLAVAVRRLHDVDRSGWWLLFYLLPLLGGFVLFVFSLLDGTRGPNRFGADPKDRGDHARSTG